MKPKLFPLLVLLLLLAGTAHAAGITGSIRLTLPAGGTVTLYRVAAAESGELLPVADFAPFGGSFSDLPTPELARELAQFAQDQGIPGVTQAIGPEKTVVFGDLEPGLYLLVQHTPSPGYDPMEPFLVTIPMEIGDTVCYDIDAAPKVTVTDRPLSPATGDDTNLPGLLLTLCLSAGALGLLHCLKAGK